MALRNHTPMSFTYEQKRFAVEHVRGCGILDENPSDIDLMVLAWIALNDPDPADMRADTINEPDNRKAISEVLTAVFQSN
jgi:hypothetical protein